MISRLRVYIYMYEYTPYMNFTHVYLCKIMKYCIDVDPLQAWHDYNPDPDPPPLHFFRIRPRPFSKSIVDVCLIARSLSFYMSFKTHVFLFMTNATNILKGLELKLKDPIRCMQWIQEIDVSSFINFRIQENRRESGDMPGRSLDPPLSLRCCKKGSYTW